MSSEGSLAPVMCPPGCNQISGLEFKLQGFRLCFCFFPELPNLGTDTCRVSYAGDKLLKAKDPEH